MIGCKSDEGDGFAVLEEAALMMDGAEDEQAVLRQVSKELAAGIAHSHEEVQRLVALPARWSPRSRRKMRAPNRDSEG